MSRKKMVVISAAAVTAAALGVFTFGESRPSADKINNASLIIGTCLIDFQALNEENQTLAENTAQDGNQDRIYYKSDLNSGVWYDITDAENVNDIVLSNNRVVDNKTIDALTLTLYFKADGTVVDLTTGNVVSVQDVDSTVLPSQIDACSSLSQQLEIANGLVDSTKDPDKDDDQAVHQHDVYVAERDSLNAILAPVSDDTTSSLSRRLNALDPLLSSLEGSAADSVASLKVKLRGQLDKHCSEVVYARIEDEIARLSDPDKSDHADLISALSDVQSALLEDMSTLDSETSSGSGTAAEKQSELEEKLISAAESGNSAEAAAQAEKLAVLGALINGESVDKSAAAEMSGELFDAAVNGVSDIADSVRNGTNDYYTDGSGVTSGDVKTALQAAVKDAENFAKDSAFYTAGSTDSEEYNRLTAEKLGELGALLEDISASAAGDELAQAVANTAAESASDILAKAAKAEALSDSALAAEKQKLANLQKQADSKYDEYIDALSAGDTAASDQKKAELDALTDDLSAARAEYAAQVDGKYRGLLEAKSDLINSGSGQTGGKDSAKAERQAQAELDALKDLLPDSDSTLLDSFDQALADLEAADAASAESAYSSLTDALKNVPEACMTDDTRARALSYAAEKLRDNGVDSLDDRLRADIAAAQSGNMKPDSGSDGSDGSGNVPGGTSAFDELYQYKLVIPKYEIYSDTLTLELDGTVFVNAVKLAELTDSQFIAANGVYVVKNDDVLIEFRTDDTAAYIGDKLFALAELPMQAGDSLYIPSGLFAAGFGLTETTENGTLFMR